MGALQVIIMAAGKGTRLKSETPKVLHALFGKPLVARVLEQLTGLPVERVHVIVGHGRDLVSAALARLTPGFPVRTVVQEPQLGTGHAVQQVKNDPEAGVTGTVLILSGDVPLLRRESLAAMLESHAAAGNDLTLLVTEIDTPKGYGRVLFRAGSSEVSRIVEEKDATPEERAVRTVNTGIYCLNWERVAPLLDSLDAQNAQGEFYLTDVVALSVAQGLKVGAVMLADPQEMLGVNSRSDLSLCHDVLNRRTQERLMQAGVTILNPCSSMLAPEVTIGPDSVVYPGCYLEGDISIGPHCTIGPHSTLKGTVRIGERTIVAHSQVTDSVIGDDNYIGPFAHMRDGAEIAHHVRVGNFVEVKNSRIDHHSNAAHLAYLGDAELGVDVNIGAGTITANYDPVRDTKHRTVLEDGVKVGCNSVLIAPVTVRERASVAAGSVITREVASWSLAIARGRQTEILDWVKKTTGRLPEGKPS